MLGLLPGRKTRRKMERALRKMQAGRPAGTLLPRHKAAETACRHVGITRRTFDRWKQQWPVFRLAVEEAERIQHYQWLLRRQPTWKWPLPELDRIYQYPRPEDYGFYPAPPWSDAETQERRLEWLRVCWPAYYGWVVMDETLRQVGK